MSSGNGVIRVGRKGKKKFAFGEDGEPFEVDVVVAFQEWIAIDDSFREHEDREDRTVAVADMARYHQAAVDFAVASTGGNPHAVPAEGITTAEALEFIARLREQYDELADFFVPRKREEPASPATSGAELRFSMEPD